MKHTPQFLRCSTKYAIWSGGWSSIYKCCASVSELAFLFLLALPGASLVSTSRYRVFHLAYIFTLIVSLSSYFLWWNYFFITRVRRYNLGYHRAASCFFWAFLSIFLLSTKPFIWISLITPFANCFQCLYSVELPS